MQCYYEGQCGMLQQCISKICEHDLIFPMTRYTAFVYTIIPFVLGIGMIGGLGGGVLKGPILMMMLNYSLKDSTIISYALMFGGCVVNAAQIIFIKHPDEPDRPIINFQMAMISNCAISLGSNIGSTLNIFLPQFYITMIQEVFLASIIPYLWFKGKKERLRQKHQVRRQSAVTDQPNIQPKSFQRSLEADDSVGVINESESSQEILPLIPCLIVLWFFALTQLLMTIIPAFVSTPSSFPHCFTINYLLLIILITVNPFFTYLVYAYGKQEEEIKSRTFQNDTILLFVPNIFIGLYASGFLAGLVSGMLGLGAGMIMVPAMLYFGIHPRVASATSAFNYLFISLTNLITLLNHSLLPPQVTMFFGGLAFIGGSVIAKIGYILMEKYKLSYQVILIVIALAVSNIIAGIWYISTETERFGFQTLIQFQDNCK